MPDHNAVRAPATSTDKWSGCLGRGWCLSQEPMEGGPQCRREPQMDGLTTRTASFSSAHERRRDRHPYMAHPNR